MPDALLVDDDPNQLRGLCELVEREGFATRMATTVAEAQALLNESLPDVVLTDLVLPDGSGLDLLKALQEEPSKTQVVLVTGNATVESAVDALRLGVTDYLTKPIDLPRLKTVLANVARTLEYTGEIGVLRDELRKLGRFGPMIGASGTIQQVYDLISKVAPTEATVLVTGESGTGKELVAQTIQGLSRRRRAPFLAINCGAVSPNLIESELFGHERGSFTGAGQRHRGHFERASGGTLFLDEVAEMPLELQVKLLRVLETGEVLRIGGDQPVQADVRVVAASNRSPAQAVAEGRLREDLFYRLNVFPIALPPLRERTGDITLLAQHFLGTLNETEGTRKRFSVDAIQRLERHDWPGNVRELKNVIQRAYIMADQEIGVATLPSELGAPTLNAGGTGDGSSALKVGSSLSDAERHLILATLEHYQGDKKKTAEVLGISLKTLYNRLNVYKRE
ncbi:MAG TPA: sigma-54 dependent transcriptional regulator [Candidatus Binatia bacterium]|nr:sigma-54 dependent transcriptional regulator [Candidatus Binatia bacterium]